MEFKTIVCSLSDEIIELETEDHKKISLAKEFLPEAKINQVVYVALALTEGQGARALLNELMSSYD